MSPKSAFPKLLEPLTLPMGVTLCNRLMMGSIHTGLEDKMSLKAMATYFEERARNGVALIVTGGVAPNREGGVYPLAAKLSTSREARKHRIVTDTVHQHDAKILLQILHGGRYTYGPWKVAPSPIRSPLSPIVPRELTGENVEQTIDAFVRCAALAQDAGYDGVEIMGSEGYLINQFLVERTNQRKDQWGGDLESRQKFPLEIIRRTREVVGPKFILMYRLSMLDLVEGGSTWSEVETLAKGVEKAGTSIISTGIGWHEARIPTIASNVPRGAFSWVTKRLHGSLGIPLVTSNRINMPSKAEAILQNGEADIISVARPLLADPEWLKKASDGRELDINTCIGCNQACLDHTFTGQRSSCLVNPRACFEEELKLDHTNDQLKVAVVGGGPAGMACASAAAERGHSVTLFDAASEIGGQFNMAKKIPGKEEFYETIRYFQRKLQATGVEQNLNTRVNGHRLVDEGYQRVVLATGVSPRQVHFPGCDHSKVISYVQALKEEVTVGAKVAIIGAGGIGFDVAEFLLDPTATQIPPEERLLNVEGFIKEWGIDPGLRHPGGLLPSKQQVSLHGSRHREIYLCQRKDERLGKRLGKSTGWIHRITLRKGGVHMLSGVKYLKVDDCGLHIEVKGEPQVLEVDNVILCAGQEPLVEDDLVGPLKAAQIPTFLIGGAEKAIELDAKRAVDQGTRLAAVIETAPNGAVFNAPVEFKAKALQYLSKWGLL
eukprot:272288_1